MIRCFSCVSRVYSCSPAVSTQRDKEGAGFLQTRTRGQLLLLQTTTESTATTTTDYCDLEYCCSYSYSYSPSGRLSALSGSLTVSNEEGETSDVCWHLAEPCLHTRHQPLINNRQAMVHSFHPAALSLSSSRPSSTELVP